MKFKNLLLSILFVAFIISTFLYQYAQESSAAGVFLRVQGGTGTSTKPTDGHFPCGDGTGEYGLCEVVAGSGMTIATTTSNDGLGTWTFSSTGGGGASFGQSWDINGALQLAPTTTVNVIIPLDLSISGGDINLGTGSATTTISGNGTGIGIGTTSPGTLLSIQGAANFAGATSTIYSGLNLSFLNATSSIQTPDMIITNSAEFRGAEDSVKITARNLLIEHSSPFIRFGGTNKWIIWQNTDDTLRFRDETTDINIMELSNTGRVGIGTTTPGTLLSLQSVANFVAGTSTIYSGLDILSINATTSIETANLRITGLTNCDTIDTDASGLLSCGTDATAAGAGAFAWTDTAFGVSTTTGLEFIGGFISAASSTVDNIFTVSGVFNASSTSAFNGLATFDNGINVGGTVTDIDGDATISIVSGALRVVDVNCTNCLTVTEIDESGDWTGTLDSLEAASFLRSDAADTATGLITLEGGLTIQDGDTFTFSGDAFTDFTGDATISIVSGALRAIDIVGTDVLNATEIEDIYLFNNASDVMLGTLTADGLTLGQDENITLGAQTLDHDGTDFVFSDSISVTSTATSTFLGSIRTLLGFDTIFATLSKLLLGDGSATSTLAYDPDFGGQITAATTTGAIHTLVSGTKQFWGASMASTTVDLGAGFNRANTFIAMPTLAYPIVAEYILCNVWGGTNVAIRLRDSTNNTTNTITCTTSSTSTKQVITSGGTFTAAEGTTLEVVSQSGSSNWLHFSVWGKRTVQ